MLKLLLCMLLLSAALAPLSEAYKVLLLFPLPGRSHFFLGNGVCQALLEAGHEVTYVTPFPNEQKKHPKLREIDISALKSWSTGIQDMTNIEKLMKKEVALEGLSVFVALFFGMHVSMFESEGVQKLMSDPKEQFDVVIGEWMFNELNSGMGVVFNCPFIWFSTVDPHWMVLRLIDEISNPAYHADTTSSGTVPYSFMKRVQELMKVVIGSSFQYFYVSSLEQKEYERLIVPMIQKRGHKVPDFEEIRYNASLILGNSYVSMGSSIRLPQNYKAIGGYHIDPKVKPLPEDLKKLLDNSKHGLIYFSMGSNLKSQQMPASLKVSLLEMFGNLKQTVLWKFEEDLPNRPSNVHIAKWAPQPSILAHPNCVLFITHGGLLSTTEAIHFAKPIIGIPVFGDQFYNVDNAVDKGFAKRVDLTFDMADDLASAINDILTDPSYTSRVKELSFIYHDRPVLPSKELVHWVEHVVRTGGAPHLRSPALLVPWYQKCYLDLALVVIAILYVVKLILKKLVGLCSKQQPKKKKH